METVGISCPARRRSFGNNLDRLDHRPEHARRFGDLTLSPDLRDSAGLLVAEAHRAGQISGDLPRISSDRTRRSAIRTSLRPLLDTVRELQSYSQKSGVEGVIGRRAPGCPRSLSTDRRSSRFRSTSPPTRHPGDPGRPADRAARDRRPARTAGLTVGGRLSGSLSPTMGPGVAVSDRTKLFSSLTTKESKGTGLGCRCRSSTSSAGNEGRLWFGLGSRGRGARFRIDLPVFGAGSGVKRAARRRASATVTGSRASLAGPAKTRGPRIWQWGC